MTDKTPDDADSPDVLEVGDAEALGHEREEYPDPDSYPPATPDPQLTDGVTPDAGVAAGGTRLETEHLAG